MRSHHTEQPRQEQRQLRPIGDDDEEQEHRQQPRQDGDRQFGDAHACNHRGDVQIEADGWVAQADFHVYVDDSLPLQWAVTQTNLGNALQTLGERESGTAKFEEAVGAFREALKELTRGRVPLDWPVTQTNLGNALQTLGERESGTAKLEEAIAACRDALKEQTRERVPLDWAMSFGREGVALMLLAERKRDAAMAKTALSQINAAFETMRDGGHAPSAAYYERQLPRARALVARLGKARSAR
jgi:tetratricopeptide (TPR) repeat protein